MSALPGNSIEIALPWRVERVNDRLGFHVVDAWGTEAPIPDGHHGYFTPDEDHGRRLADKLNEEAADAAS